jgi:hypothetical protein
MAEHLCAPSTRLVVLPPGLDMRDASIVEPASVSWHVSAWPGPDRVHLTTALLCGRWPMLTSLQLEKEYALTGVRIPVRRAAEIGLANHVCADAGILDQTMACVQKIARLPKAQRSTGSYTTPELRADVARMLEGREKAN